MEIVIVGNSIAALVALQKFRDDQRSDITWVQEGDGPSGIWGGFKHGEQYLDYGMVNFELDIARNSNKVALQDYSFSALNDCANFVADITKFLQTITETFELPPIKILQDGKFYSDFLLSNDLKDFLDYSRTYGILIQPNLGEYPHPSQKYSDVGFESFSENLIEYCVKIYGSSFVDKVITPWGKRLLGNDLICLETQRHRSAWIPLYYPETLLAAVKGELSLKPNSFRYPVGSTISEMWRHLYNTICSDQSIKLAKLSDLTSRHHFGNYDLMVWATSLDKYHDRFLSDTFALKHFKRGKIDVKFFEVDFQSKNFNYCVLNMNKQDESWYRATVSPNFKSLNSKSILCVEYLHNQGINFTTGDFKSFDELGVKDAVNLGEFKGIPVFSLPTEKERRDILSRIKSFQNYDKKLRLVGPALMPFAQTMNDQIIQGLQVSSV
jgi:hypothetical protein